MYPSKPITPERWQQIQDLFHAARERASTGLVAFLAEACGDDSDLKREVESLLAFGDSRTETTDGAGTPGRTTAMPPGETEPRAGTMMGPYLLESLIGTGGMGRVFRATDTRLRRAVAIKLLLPKRVADPGYKRRFLQEARAASALNHPNIVALYDICNDDGNDFLVMEFVQGQTLQKFIADGPLPVDSVIRIGEKIASALAAAHEAGVLHRDIKPANIMITPGRQVKVLDFGIASIAAPAALDSGGESPTETRLTNPGTVVGTVSYMSPEQARGAAADARSDIFSLGCVLYEAVTGRLPFHGANVLAIMHEILSVDPVAPGTLCAGMPYDLDRLIVRCLRKDPAQRPASVAEVERALQSLASFPEPVAYASQSGRRSVAVIPFRFRTAAPEDQFLSMALAESVVNRLASSGELVVRPVASVLRYAGTDIEWTQVARELNVDHVVEGTIQKSGTKVRVLVQAVQASDSRPLHSARHDGDMTDLFSLQDRIADSVSDALIPRTKADSGPTVAPTSNPLAYELYMRAVDRLTQWNKFDITSAIGMLDRAVESDPNFADAWGQLAYACSQMGMHLDPDRKWFERAEQAITHTLDLDPLQCDALCAGGQILWSPSRGFQNLPALRAMNAALRIHPGRYNFRHFRGVILFHLGFLEQAEHDMRESLAANPGYALAVTTLGTIVQYKGDFETADALFVRSMKLDPMLLHTNVFSPLTTLLLGRFEETKARIRRARQIVPEESKLTSIEGLLAAHEGNWKRAEELADDSCSENQRSMTHTHHTWHNAAGVYAMCGKPEKALFQLRRCAAFGLPNYRLFTTDPHLKALRGHPDFTALMSDLRREHDRYRAAVEPIVVPGGR